MQEGKHLNMKVTQSSWTALPIASDLCKDQSLLIGGDAFLVLNLLLHSLNGVRRVHVQGDGFAREGLDENLNK